MVRQKALAGAAFPAGWGLLLSFLALDAVAQGAPPEPEQVTITGSRLGSDIRDLATTVSIVPEQELATQLSISTDVLEALDVTVPGLSVSRGTRIGCDSNIRGRTASYQINGIPVNQDLRASNCNAMFQISPFALERIEVVRGATAIYGAGAPGGIVNLITRRARSEQLEFDGVAQYSFNPDNTSGTGQYDVYTGAGQRLANWDWYLGGAYQDVGAARAPESQLVPREEYRSWSFNGSTGLDLMQAGRLRLTGTYYRQNGGQEYLPDFELLDDQGFPAVRPVADNPYKDDQGYDQLYSLFGSYEVDNVLGHRIAIAAFMQQQTFIQRANFNYFSSFGDDFFNSDTENGHYGFRSTLAKSFMLGQNEFDLTYGFDYVANRFYRPQVDPGTGDITGFVSPEITLRTYALFAQGALDFGRFSVIGGARKEVYRGEVGSEGFDPVLRGAATPGDIGESDLWLFNIGGIFDLTPTVQIYGGFSQGAELTELGRAARNVTDPSRITPEPATSDQYEIGVRGNPGRWAYTAAAFYSESDNASELQADPTCVGQSFCPLIPLRAPQRFHGVELTLDWTLDERLRIGGLLTYQRGEIFDETLGSYIEYSTDVVSPFRVTGYVEFELLPNWRNRVQATYFSEADYFTPAELDFGRVSTESAFVVDLMSNYALGPGILSLGISNLFNDEYVNVTNQAGGIFSVFYYREEGRRLSLAYRVRL
jgi:iron complex outermembrane recepter protein